MLSLIDSGCQQGPRNAVAKPQYLLFQLPCFREEAGTGFQSDLPADTQQAAGLGKRPRSASRGQEQTRISEG